jgi:hypothetical protein
MLTISDPSSERDPAARSSAAPATAGTGSLADQVAGDLDPTFGTGGEAPSPEALGAFAIQPDGKIVVVQVVRDVEE